MHSEDKLQFLFCTIGYAMCNFADPLCPVQQVRKQILLSTLQRRNQSQQYSRELLQSSCHLLVISFPSVFKSMWGLSKCRHNLTEHLHIRTHLHAYLHSAFTLLI